MREEFDHIVIGAGMGGLAAACLLVKKGRRVLLLEAHTAAGGCVSYFARKRFLFDAGATTLSGMGHEQPVQRLLRTLGLDLPVRRCDPGMIVHTAGGAIPRWSDPERWSETAARTFGGARQRAFWSKVREVSSEGWRASAALPFLPLDSISAVASLPGALRFAPLGRHLFRSVGDVLRELGLGDDRRFRSFIAEQLLITAQSDPDDTPFLVGAMGLEYPADTWYVDGGLNALARAMQQWFTENGGTLMLRTAALSVQTGPVHAVTTDTKRVFHARSVISNATGWSNRELFPSMQRFFDKEYAGLAGWGAFTLYVGLRNEFDDGGSPFHQIITDEPLPVTGGRSFFLSFSHPQDASRAPEGYRTLTVSTHVPDPHRWRELPEREIAERKQALTDAALAIIGLHLPGFAGAEKPVVMTGTPVTFEHFTRRPFGQVGGIPHSMHRPLFAWPGWRTGTKGVSLVGDTVYPGQGIPGVFLGALNLVRALES